jgi:hypothetical protein
VVSNSTSCSVSGGQTPAFTLKLYTTDGVGRTHWAVKYVIVDSNNFELMCS